MVNRRETTCRAGDALERRNGFARALETDQDIAELAMNFRSRGIAIDALFEEVGSPRPVATGQCEIPKFNTRKRLTRVGGDGLFKARASGGGIATRFCGIAHVHGAVVAHGR